MFTKAKEIAVTESILMELFDWDNWDILYWDDSLGFTGIYMENGM